MRVYPVDSRATMAFVNVRATVEISLLEYHSLR